MGERRDLTFSRIDEVMPEVERLLGGHETAKGWTLGQILHHLATAIRLGVRGGTVPPPAPPGPEQERTFAVRRRRLFRSGRFAEGLEVPDPALRPPADADERAGAGSLREAIRELEAARGPFPVHPYLGAMSKDEWVAFHRIHCAHHLGFAKILPPSREGSPSHASIHPADPRSS